MTKRVQQLRSTQAVLRLIPGLVGQIIVNLSRMSVHVMDGVTLGGFELARADASNIQDATTTQAGRMTTAHVQQLDTASSDIATLQGSASDLDTAIQQLEQDTNDAIEQQEINKIDKITGGAENFLVFQAANGTVKSGGMPFFQAGFLLKTASLPPTGWSLNTSHNDRIDLTTTNTGLVGATGGSWTINSITVQGHTLQVSEIPPHWHAFTINPIEGKSNAQGGAWSTSGPTQFSGATELEGGGAAHTHDLSITSAWRPAFTRTLWISRNALS